MLKAWVERVKVLGNISIVKWQSVAFIVQQDTNLCGGNSNSDVWCHPTVQEFVLVPVGKKHSQKIPHGTLHADLFQGMFSCCACMVKTVLSLFPHVSCLLLQSHPLCWAMLYSAFPHSLIPLLGCACLAYITGLHIHTWLEMSRYWRLGQDDVKGTFHFSNY